jgi:hypothetical protein
MSEQTQIPAQQIEKFTAELNKLLHDTYGSSHPNININFSGEPNKSGDYSLRATMRTAHKVQKTEEQFFEEYAEYGVSKDWLKREIEMVNKVTKKPQKLRIFKFRHRAESLHIECVNEDTQAMPRFSVEDVAKVINGTEDGKLPKKSAKKSAKTEK